MSDFLFQVIIYPIKLMIEIIYMLFDWIFKGNTGVSILGVSAAVSLFCLPLYAKAEKLQEKERAIQAKMARKTASIKKCFSGDEQYMLLSTYYRQNGYHPIYALRSSVSLLIQVPFFIAAYSFLSHLQILQGQSFSFISDLGAEDSLLTIGKYTVNVLPVLMTAINAVSGAIYTKGFPFREKAQLYAMSAIFLVLLYHSPSALVLYWTLNNVFSLIKNLVFKIKNPLRFLYLCMCSALALFCFYVFFVRRHGQSNHLRNLVLTAGFSAFLACIPLYIRLARRAAHTWLSPLFEESASVAKIFIFSIAGLWVLYGMAIPFNLAASSPFEFSYIGRYTSPFGILYFPLVQALGFFVFWPLYFFLLFPKKIKILLAVGMSALLFSGILSVFVFPVNFGTVSQTLQYTNGGLFTVGRAQLALPLAGSVLALFSILFLAGKKRLPLVSAVLLVLLLAETGSVLYKGITIQQGFSRYSEIREQDRLDSLSGGEKPVFDLSTTGRNVFIIMMDKAISSYLPILFRERPELADSYSGFVFYPNTVSYGNKTILGAPPLFGGYEYTPGGMNARLDIPMVKKHNESLLMLPTLFRENGFASTITNAPFVNYDWVADNRIFREKGISATNLIGNFTARYQKEKMPEMESYSAESLLRRNLLIFSFLASVPAPLKNAVYNNGLYWNSSILAVNTLTLDSYAALYYLDRITGNASEGDTFSVMVNDLTHESNFLQYPDYTFESRITDTGKNIFGDDGFENYHVNAASLILLGKWLDRLKEMKVYDNTRIIIVSDHGDRVNNPDLTAFQNGTVTAYNPLLLVKDFNRKDVFSTDGTFMTNADVPLIAASGLIENPVNPYTGAKLTAEGQKDTVNIVLESTIHQGFSPDLLTRTTCYEPGAAALQVEKNIFDEENWKTVKMDQ
jgi:YidC/Oxa1 family membrane protein insertase